MAMKLYIYWPQICNLIAICTNDIQMTFVIILQHFSNCLMQVHEAYNPAEGL